MFFSLLTALGCLVAYARLLHMGTWFIVSSDDDDDDDDDTICN